MHVLIEGVQEIGTMFQIMEHGKVKTISRGYLSFQIFMLSNAILDENIKCGYVMVKRIPGWQAVPSPKGKNCLFTLLCRIILTQQKRINRKSAMRSSQDIFPTYIHDSPR